MSSSRNGIAASTSAPTQTIEIPPLTVEEEDDIIHTRITNDERPLRRVLKKFHGYTAVAHDPVVPSVIPSTPGAIEDARESFLVELASFQLLLKKSALICEAEARQVEEYQRERQRIDDEHGTLRGQIEQLKTSLEHEQMLRRRKIDYDLVAEKVNTLPSRADLERSIEALENDMAAIRTEHETQNRTIQGQKSALDGIVSELGSLRMLGKDTDVPTSEAPSTRTTPAPEGESSTPARLVDVYEPPTKRGVLEDIGIEMPPADAIPSIQTVGENDIEMGEVEEEPKFKKKIREEELEEGEASDSSSALSDPPDD